MRRLFAASLGLILASDDCWALCPMCKKALEESGSGLIAGFYWSIVLLCAIPLLVFAAAGWKYAQFKRKADAS